MKINPHFQKVNLWAYRANARPTTQVRREQGSAAMVVIAILAIVLLYVAANLRTLEHLNREIKLVERRQVHRLERCRVESNTVTQAVAPAASPVGSSQSF
jgi:hypothetical protein